MIGGPFPHGETVVRVRRTPVLGPGGQPVRDERGQPVYGPAVETNIPGCAIEPRMQSRQAEVGGDEQQARDTVIVGYTVYAPPETDIVTTDQVRIRGETCDITGEPGSWQANPFTGTRGPLQFAADRVTG